MNKKQAEQIILKQQELKWYISIISSKIRVLRFEALSTISNQISELDDERLKISKQLSDIDNEVKEAWQLIRSKEQ